MRKCVFPMARPVKMCLANRVVTLAALTTIAYFALLVQDGLVENKPPFSWTKDTVLDINSNLR